MEFESPIIKMTKRSASYSELESSLQEMISSLGGLLETRWVNRFTDLMKKATDLDCRSMLIKVLLNTNQNDKTIFSRLVQLGGVETLGQWIDESRSKSDQESKSLIQSILSFLNKLSFTKEFSFKTSIASILESLKTMPDTGIQVKASSILSRWEKLSFEEDRPSEPDPKKK
jgi:hypothetical protein